MSVKIERVGNRIYLRAPYPISGLKEKIPGSSFSSKGPTGPRWSIPLSLVNCRMLREEFGKNLVIGPLLWAWAAEEKASQERMGALSRSTDAELIRLHEVAPKLAKAMDARRYQRVGVRYVADHRGPVGCLLADDPGLGKTLQAIGGIVESGEPGPYLVVCPKTAVESVWARELHRWLGGTARVITLPDGRAKRESILGAMAEVSERAMRSDDPSMKYALANTWLVVNPEVIRARSFWVCGECGEKTETWAGPKNLVCDHDASQAPRVNEYSFRSLFEIEWGAVIFDESHLSLVRKTGKNTQTRNGADLLPIRPSGLRLAMSGTPWRGKRHYLWGTLNWLAGKKYSSATRWTDTYFEVGKGYNGSRIVGELRPEREEDLYRELDAVMLRRTKAEAAPDMPPKTYAGTPLVGEDESSPIGVWLPLGAVQQRLYDQMQRDSVALIEGGTLDAIGILAELTRLKQFATCSGRLVNGEFQPAAPSAKLDWIVEHLEELGIADGRPVTRVVIVSQFTSVLKMFAGFLSQKGIRTSMVIGEVTGSKRAKVIDDFNTLGVGPDVLLLNVKAGGVAITIDSADEMIFLDETWVDDDQKQAEDRIHRVSKPRPVTYYYLRSTDTVEESIAHRNYQQKTNNFQLLDGRRGADIARMLVKK